MSLYSGEDRNSLCAVTDCYQTSSEIAFDFDDIVVTSAAYRRVLLQLHYQLILRSKMIADASLKRQKVWHPS